MNTTYTNSRSNRHAFADSINSLALAGAAIEVAGREVTQLFRSQKPATVYGNGTIAIDVVGRSTGTVGTVWVKPGQTVSVTIEVELEGVAAGAVDLDLPVEEA